MKRKKLFPLLVLLLVLAGLFFAARFIDGSRAVSSGAGLSPTREKYAVALPTLVWQGKTYEWNSKLRTILFIGVDKEGPAEDSGVYYNLGHADFLMLGIVNDEEKTFSLLHVNRDTMAEVTLLGLGGKRAGTSVMQIALSHTYGSGMELSCENTVEAVSRLLLDTPVDRYLAMQVDGVGKLNDGLGGITLTLSEDIPGYPRLKKGETVTLQGDEALAYVRGRMTVADGTNVNRMGRQREYIRAFIDALRAKADDIDFAEKALVSIEDYYVTDMQAGELVSLSSLLTDYSFAGMEAVEGTMDYSHDFAEFYVDGEALIQQLIRLCYLPRE